MLRKQGSPEKIEAVKPAGQKLFMKEASCKKCQHTISLGSRTWAHSPVVCPECGEKVEL